MIATGTSFSRVWAMPCSDTFDCPPIERFVRRYLADSNQSVDPFARNKRWATCTNDLNPNTVAEHHLDAEDFLAVLHGKSMDFDLAIVDPPYSPRQISECYKEAGLKATMKDTQNAALYSRVKSAVAKVMRPGGGWCFLSAGTVPVWARSMAIPLSR